MGSHWLTSHDDEETFRFQIVGKFEDCLSKQGTEAVMIHYSPDILLNSKNEYNANCLAKVRVDETKYDQNRERLEAIEEAKAWTKFKYKKPGFGERKENESIPEVNPRATKPRMDQR